MALRAKKRQGGGSNFTKGIGSVLANGVPGAAPPQAKGPAKGISIAGGGTKPTVNTPSATYQRRALSIAPSAPVASSSSAAMRTNAASALARAQGENRDAIFRAVMQLGDTSQFAKYQNDPRFAGMQFTQDPNSIFASLARQEKQGLEDIDEGANIGNTYFSGRRLNDRQKLSDETNRQRLAGSTSFGDDLRSYASVLGSAEDSYRGMMADADQMDIDAALERDRIAREEAEAAAAAAAAEGPVKGLAPSAPPAGTHSDPGAIQRYLAAVQRQKQEEAHRRAVEAARRAARRR